MLKESAQVGIVTLGWGRRLGFIPLVKVGWKGHGATHSVGKAGEHLWDQSCHLCKVKDVIKFKALS